MYTRTDPSQQWTVHAQFTISHDGLHETPAPQTRTEQDENGVRMVYTWTSQPGGGVEVPSDSAENLSQNSFQRGNMVFTSTPPTRREGGEGLRKVYPDGDSMSKLYPDRDGVRKVYPDSDGIRKVYPAGDGARKDHPDNDSSRRSYLSNDNTRRSYPDDASKLGLNVDSSGYGSELLSPNSFASANFPRRPSVPYNRRCRSTCSIVLSTNINEIKDDSESQSQCGRTHSLRCQTPTLRCERKDAFYGCGDPWCYHSNYGEDLRFSPVPEGEEYSSSSKRPSRASTYTAHRSKSSPPRFEKWRDASVQTHEMVDKCTSPFSRMGSFDFSKGKSEKSGKEGAASRGGELKKRAQVYGPRRKTEPVHQRSQSPSSITPDSLDSLKTTKRAVRTPGRLQVPQAVKNSNTSNSSDPNKKPRTVHIDVYCTGTELDSDSSSSSTDSDEKTASSPQTVFESGKVKITHKREEEDSMLPYKLRENLNLKANPAQQGKENESELDDLSTAYPSRSSFSGLRDIDSSFSSVPPSWSTMSMSSSCAIPDDESLSINTSWKDTVSDFGSMSRSSIAQTDSLDFVPRKLIQNQTRSSIDELPERELLETPVSIQASDSFEYEDSEDRARIQLMENLWRSPQVERKHMLQQRRMKEYIEKRLSDKSLPKWESKDTESDGSDDDEEKGWSFVKDEPVKAKKLERDTTVRKASRDELEKDATVSRVSRDKFGRDTGSRDALVRRVGRDEKEEQLVCEEKKLLTACSKSPSVLIIKQKMSQNPTLRAPFTLVPGVFTEQREKAKRFGRIVDVFKKPGHHIGPAKNPDCTCDHCRSYFENFIGCRGRARSVDSNYSNYYNWRELSRGSEPPDRLGSRQENMSASHLG